jgi:succinyldiaminopimelate transaminase
MTSAGFVPPPYPYDRLDAITPLADAHEGGRIDLSIGTPCDPPPPSVLSALANSNAERGYPASIGSLRYREAASEWLARRFGVAADPAFVGACVGTKEFVALLPQLLHLRSPERDTILYPAVSYPTYAMGATLAGLRAVPVPVDSHWRIDLSRILESDARRALALWVNTPGNPAGGLDDLDAAAAWGRARGVPVFSDECYIEFTWDGPGRSILRTGPEGVVAVHSLSKRSNLAGGRAGFYTGDPELVHYLQELRKHAGLMVPGPIQAAAVAAFADDVHVDVQRDRYHRRLVLTQRLLRAFDVEAPLPAGGFYLWAPAPDGDAWALTRRLATDAGVLVSPGEFYGDAGAGYVRLAVVQPDEAIERAAARVGVSIG